MHRVGCYAVVGMLASSVLGCASGVRHDTLSAKPEITVDVTDSSVVRAQVMKAMLSQKYNVVEETDSMVVFDGPMDKAMAAAVFGNGYESTPHARVTCTFIETGKAVRVVADLKAVTHDGPALERFTDMNKNRESVRFQEMLDGIRGRVEPIAMPQLASQREEPVDVVAVARKASVRDTRGPVRRYEFLRQ